MFVTMTGDSRPGKGKAGKHLVRALSRPTASSGGGRGAVLRFGKVGPEKCPSTHHTTTAGLLLSFLPVFVKSPLVPTSHTAHLDGVPAVAGAMSGCGPASNEGSSHCPQLGYRMVDQ